MSLRRRVEPVDASSSRTGDQTRGRLAEVERDLALLTAERAVLRRQLDPGPGTPLPTATPAHVPGPPSRSPQALLLVVGGVLVGLALVVFAGVGYRTLSSGGRAVVLGLLTVVVGAAAHRLVRSRLRFTAEVAVALFTLLLLLDVYGAWALGLAGLDRVDGPAYWAAGLAVSTALVASLTGRSLVAAVVAPALGQVALGTAVLGRLALDTAGAATLVAVGAGLDALLARRLHGGRHTVLRYGLGVWGGLLAAVAGSAAAAADDHGSHAAVLAYVVLLGVAMVPRAPARLRVDAIAVAGAAVAQSLLGPLLGVGGRALVVGVVALGVVALGVRSGGRVAAALRGPVPGWLLTGKALLLATGAAAAAPGDWPGTRAHPALVGAAVACAAAAWLLTPRVIGGGVAVGCLAGAAAAFGLGARPLACVELGFGLVVVIAASVRWRVSASGVLAGGLVVAVLGWSALLATRPVEVVEPYTLAIAGALLHAGRGALRLAPRLGSSVLWPGIVVAGAPSLLIGLTSPSGNVRRLLITLVVAVLVLVAGLAVHYASLFTGGAAVALLAALELVGPPAAQLPRWITLGAAGAVLLWVGVTFEARRRDVGRARAALVAWR